jgi:hypothetical protein
VVIVEINQFSGFGRYAGPPLAGFCYSGAFNLQTVVDVTPVRITAIVQ